VRVVRTVVGTVGELAITAGVLLLLACLAFVFLYVYVQPTYDMAPTAASAGRSGQ